jgi:hypothetical protein
VKFILGFFLLAACVDPLDVDFPEAGTLLVVEGMITTDQVPYFVKLSKAFSLDKDDPSTLPVPGAQVILLSDKGESETLVEFSPGEYKSTGQITGAIGVSYHIQIQLADGRTYESAPDKLYAAGEIESIRYEHEGRTAIKQDIEVQADVFNIFVDATVPQEETHRTRWRFTGTYKAETNPELHMIYPMDPFWLKDPLPCSGYIVAPGFNGGILEQRSECICCTCWASQYEEAPVLSDGVLQSNGRVSSVKITEVPITTATFYEKYRVAIEQMSLSEEAFNFFKIIRNQKLAYQDLFQASPGELRGNIKASNKNDQVVGLFYATSIHRKQIFIDRSAVPYNLPPSDFVTDACYNYYPNSTTTKPAEW